MRREFLQLAQVLNPAKHKIGGFYMSEKLDGTRCFWDGGLTRGMKTEEVPWASITDPKTGERKLKIKPYSTGLWSRYGNPIIAPDWFLNTLPACFLDGELWAGHGSFQLCRSICGGDTPDPRFDKIQYMVYSAPSFESLFADGEIKNTNMCRTISYPEVWGFVEALLEDFEGDFHFCPAKTFEDELKWLGIFLETQTKQCVLHVQEKLPASNNEAHLRVAEFLDYVLEQKGEGVVLRDPSACWTPKRHTGILKWKPYQDAEGTITGFTTGRETTKGSRLLGKIGALIVDYKGKRLELAGLTDAEREFDSATSSQWAVSNPDRDVPASIEGKHFKRGEVVTFKYRELTDEGIPKEAHYFRRRDVE